jgi:hypothetical protein
MFFHFYHVKSLSPGKPVSISSQPNMGLFTLYASNFKNYKDTFLCVRNGPRLPGLMFDSEGHRLFPFYWTPDPRLIKEESNIVLKDSLGEKYAEGFAAALDQVKILFPGLDETTLSEVDLLKFVEDGKLVSRLPQPEKASNEVVVDEQLGSESR